MARPRKRAAQGRHGAYIPSDFSARTKFRAQVLDFRARGHSRKETAEAFGVSGRTITRWQALCNATGSLAPQLHRVGRKRILSTEEVAKLRQLLEDNPFLTDKQLAEELGGKITAGGVNRYVTEMGFAPKVPAKGDEPLTPHIITETKNYLRQLRRIPMRDRVYVDETAVYANAYPRRGRALPGVRIGVPLPANARRYTVYWAITQEGQLHPPILQKGNCNDQSFLQYVTQTLAPLLRPGMTVIWDRLGRSGRTQNPQRIHYNPQAIQAIEARGCRVLFLPPKGKYFNPIEEGNNAMKLGVCIAYNNSPAKATLRQRTMEELQRDAAAATARFTPDHYKGWFRHRGTRAAFDEAYPNNEV